MHRVPADFGGWEPDLLRVRPDLLMGEPVEEFLGLPDVNEQRALVGGRNPMEEPAGRAGSLLAAPQSSRALTVQCGRSATGSANEELWPADSQAVQTV